MQRSNLTKSHALALFIAGLFAIGSMLPEKPAWAGDDKGDKHDKHEKKSERKKHKSHEHDHHDDESEHDRGNHDVRVQVYFGDQHRVVVHDYYARQFYSGRCPPGLAKKGNGCRSPGYAKKWRVGQTLPRDVIYYDLPPAIVVQLGAPLPRHRYVRVATDILLIAVGTGLIVDALEDLEGM